MSSLFFTRDEFDKLELIKSYLDKRVNSITCERTAIDDPASSEEKLKEIYSNLT